jgi:hypothetical protein
MEPDTGVRPEPILDTTKEVRAEQAHPDINRAAELGADRRGRESRRTELIGWIPFDDLDLACEAQFLKKIATKLPTIAPPTMTTVSADDDTVTPELHSF